MGFPLAEIELIRTRLAQLRQVEPQSQSLPKWAIHIIFRLNSRDGKALFILLLTPMTSVLLLVPHPLPPPPPPPPSPVTSKDNSPSSTRDVSRTSLRQISLHLLGPYSYSLFPFFLPPVSPPRAVHRSPHLIHTPPLLHRPMHAYPRPQRNSSSTTWKPHL